jgi:hypothetical protein
MSTNLVDEITLLKIAAKKTIFGVFPFQQQHLSSTQQ